MSQMLTKPLTALKRVPRAYMLVPIAGVLVLALLLVTTVWADTTPTTYYACVNPHSGTIQMTTADAGCLSSETEISWNQVGPQGPAGPRGPAGPIGPQGPAGPSKNLSVATVFSTTVSVSPGGYGNGEVICPTGSYAMNGSILFTSPEGYEIVRQGPIFNSTGWGATVKNASSSGDLTFEVYASCLSLS